MYKTRICAVPGVCPWQLFGGSPLLYGEELRSITPVELCEAVHRNARRASHKLQQARPRLIVHRVHGLGGRQKERVSESVFFICVKQGCKSGTMKKSEIHNFF